MNFWEMRRTLFQMIRILVKAFNEMSLENTAIAHKYDKYGDLEEITLDK